MAQPAAGQVMRREPTVRRPAIRSSGMSHSRFYLCDLQVHTPADSQQEYGNVGGREPNSTFARQLVEAHASAGVEVFAVTDHNRVDWYPVLREAGDAAGVSVFPGLEFSVQGCHLLAIWDRTDDGYRLATQFLHRLWKPGDSPFAANGDPRPVTKGGVVELAREAREHQALVLAPHCTSKGIGLFAPKVCRNSGEVARSGYVLGFDVVGNPSADVLINPRSEFGDVPPSWFISGDVRSLDKVGTRAIYLKLGSEPTVEGLRQAFLMPETRIRFPERLRSDWGHVAGVRFIKDPAPTWPRLTRIEVAGGFHDGLSVDFGPGLTAIIGGKGTGKSTLVEILRYVLDAGDPIEEEGANNRRHNFGANAEATVDFVDAEGDRYEVRRSGDGTPAVLLRGEHETGVDVPRRMAVRVFGQRELRALGRQPDLLRSFVASQTGAEWESLASKEMEVLSSLRGLAAEMRSLEADLAHMENAEGDLTDKQDRLRLAAEKGLADLVQASKDLAARDDAIRTALGWPNKVSSAVDNLREVLPAPSDPENVELPEGMVEALESLQSAVREGLTGLAEAVQSCKTRLEEPTRRWEVEYEDARKRLARELAEAGFSQPQELEKLQREVARLEREIAALPEKRQRHEDLSNERTNDLQKLASLRRAKSRMIEKAARSLTESVGPQVRLRINAMADRTELLRILNRATKGQGIRRDQLERLSRIAPMKLAKAIREGAEKIQELGCTATTASKLASLPPEVVREIEEADTPDDIRLQIELGPPGSEAWTDITEVSPGQSATALLALILTSGTEPLVIDQPEDDLDNRYIYDEVVKVIARVCENRQVIVATHNANIPILGDAEMIIALDAAADRSRVLAAGGIEIPEVAASARQILEGGDAAFQARQRRYLAASPD